MPPYKAVVLDCDNTLWRGICGEDGPTGVVLDPARRAMHEFLLEQREAGMLLTMASKNNESDVLETFASNPDFPLQLRHFTSWRLNWESKADNLVALSNELGLGLDSFVFIDDNPKECAEVEDGLPDVLTLALPEPIQETPAMLRHVWAFDHPVITEEDRNRNAYYERQGQFGREARRAASLEHFLAGLNLQVRIMPLAADKVARAAQLTQRTNQFNTTSIRRTEADFLTLADHTLTVEVSDRFGDYGLTGLVISRPVAGGLEIDSLMLSCRVLGRGVEHRVLSHLGKLTDGDLFIPLGITSRNQPARQFLESVAPPVSRTEMGMLFRLPAPSVRELEWKPSGTAPPATRPQPSPTAARRHFMGYARIARSLSSVDQIRAVMRAAQPRTDRQYASDTERRLAAIWSELLQKPSIAPQDNFFDLGGHSLVAVLLIMRVREVFGVELPIDDVYSGDLTIARLAARIDVHRLSRADPGDYAALVAEIESLTDEEVRELLEKEDLDACASS
jgi:FkbH-like protein